MNHTNSVYDFLALTILLGSNLQHGFSCIKTVIQTHPKIKKINKAGFNDALIEPKEIFDFLQRPKKTDNADPSRHFNKPPPYTHIKTNRPMPAVKRFYENQESPCSPDSNCLNRILMKECIPSTCPTGEKCFSQ
jgi:hypothetical protein